MYSMVALSLSEDISIVYSSTKEEAAKGNPMIAHSKWKYCSVSKMLAATIEYAIIYLDGEPEP